VWGVSLGKFNAAIGGGGARRGVPVGEDAYVIPSQGRSNDKVIALYDEFSGTE
jgi:hypothetical protein